MKDILKRALISSIIIALMVWIDQYTKSFFISYLKTRAGYILHINSFLDMVYSWNYGISMGLFDSHHKYSNAIFLVINSSIIAYLLLAYIIDKNSPKFYLVVIGGGGGNLFDRFTRGAVFDFISVHYQEYYFPAFNVADMFISLGVIMLFWELFYQKKNGISNP